MSAGWDEEVPATADEDILEDAVVDTLTDRRCDFGQIGAVHRPTDILEVRDSTLQGRKMETCYLLVRPDIVRRFEVAAEEFHVSIRVPVRTGGLLCVTNAAVVSRVCFDIVD